MCLGRDGVAMSRRPGCLVGKSEGLHLEDMYSSFLVRHREVSKSTSSKESTALSSVH